MNRISTVMIASTAAALLTACNSGSEADIADADEAEIDYSLNCNESRGALWTYSEMAAGRERVDITKMAHPGHFLQLLIEERGSPPEVVAWAEKWEEAGSEHLDQLHALQPVFEPGRSIEPDTSAIEASLMQQIAPSAKALTTWVNQQCGEIAPIIIGR